jgi:hypothetical protein
LPGVSAAAKSATEPATPADLGFPHPDRGLAWLRHPIGLFDLRPTIEQSLATANLNGASCHGGTAFTHSGSNSPGNIGTIKPGNGWRGAGAMTGIDAPTLRDFVGHDAVAARRLRRHAG